MIKQNGKLVKPVRLPNGLYKFRLVSLWQLVSSTTHFFGNLFLFSLVPFSFGNLFLCENTVSFFNREGTAEDRVILDCVTSLQHGEDLSSL